MKIPKRWNIAKCLSFLFFCFLEKDNYNSVSFHSWIKSGSTEHLSWLPPLLRARRQSQAKRLRLFILVLCPGQEISNVRDFSTIIYNPLNPPCERSPAPCCGHRGGPPSMSLFSNREEGLAMSKSCQGQNLINPVQRRSDESRIRCWQEASFLRGKQDIVC